MKLGGSLGGQIGTHFGSEFGGAFGGTQICWGANWLWGRLALTLEVNLGGHFLGGHLLGGKLAGGADQHSVWK